MFYMFMSCVLHTSLVDGQIVCPLGAVGPSYCEYKQGCVDCNCTNLVLDATSAGGPCCYWCEWVYILDITHCMLYFKKMNIHLHQFSSIHYFDIFSFGSEDDDCCLNEGGKKEGEVRIASDRTLEYRLTKPTDYVEHIVSSTKHLLHYILTNNCTRSNVHGKLFPKISNNQVSKYIAKYFGTRITIWGKDRQMFPNVVIKRVLWNVSHFDYICLPINSIGWYCILLCF